MVRHFKLALGPFTLIDTSHYFLHKAHFNAMVTADKTVNSSERYAGPSSKQAAIPLRPLYWRLVCCPLCILLSRCYALC
jgi:hypothetical protein